MIKPNSMYAIEDFTRETKMPRETWDQLIRAGMNVIRVRGAELVRGKSLIAALERTFPGNGDLK